MFVCGTKPRTTTILFVGRVMPIKNVEQIILITKELLEKGIEVRTRIIGNTPDSEYIHTLEKLLDTTKTRSHIVFVGSRTQKELVKEYGEALIMVNPSDTDSFDKVVIEAMAAGAIPLTSNETFRNMLSPHKLYIEKGDIQGYVERITHCLAEMNSTDTLRQTLRNLVSEKYSLQTLPNRIFGPTTEVNKGE